ncbi:unnamed protein product [Merluccius merluccius]
MALHVRSRAAASCYAAPAFCRHFSAPPLSYADGGHYLSRFPGPESIMKPPLSLFSHAQQPFHHMDALHPLGPPPPPPMASAQTLGPPPPMIPAPTLIPTQTLGPPPPMAAPHGPPPCLPPILAPVSCPIPGPPPPGPPHPGPLPAQAAPAGELPQDEGSPLGMEEQEGCLGLEELCKPLYCKLCNVTLNSAQQAHAHYQGKNHSKKLRNFYAGSQQPSAVRIPEVLESGVQVPLGSGPGDGDAGRQALYKGATRVILATENDYCKLCDASFSSLAVAAAHYQGKNHAKKLRLADAQQHASNTDGSEASQRRHRKDSSEYRLMKSRRAAQVLPLVPGPYFNPRPRQRIPRDLAMCVTPSGQFYCSMCDSGAEREADFRLHLESKLHKAKVSELRYRHEMENLGYS